MNANWRALGKMRWLATGLVLVAMITPFGDSIWGRCEPEVWVTGGYEIDRWNGSTWQAEPIAWPSGVIFISGVAGGATRTWAVGAGGSIFELVR